MSPIAVLLALGSTIRPTSLAAVDALLVSARARRLLLAYVVAGVLVSVGIGVLLVSVLHHVVAASPRGHAGFELLFGLGALAAAVLVARRPREAGSGSADHGGRIAARLRDPSVVAAAVAGILTHFPGVFYIAALDAIISTNPGFVDGVVQVCVYNAIWFAVPIAALTLSIVDHERTRARVDAANAWARRHEHTAGPLLLVAVGAYLVVKALVELL